jgi:hypothetical protein
MKPFAQSLFALVALVCCFAVFVPASIIQAIIPQVVPSANKQGNGTLFQLSTGSVTNGHCAEFDANGNTIDAGGVCGTGSGNMTTSGANTMGSAGTLDASGETSAAGVRVPNIAGASSTTTGAISYDTTNKNWHVGSNGKDNLLALFPSASIPTNGHCVEWSVSSNVVVLADTGSACGSGGGGGSASTPVLQSFSTITRSLTFPANVQSGDLLLMGVCSDSDPTSLTDGQSNTWTEVDHVNNSGWTSLWSATASASGSLTVTVNGPSTANDCETMNGMEVAGAKTLDVTTHASTAGATITTTMASDLIVVVQKCTNNACVITQFLPSLIATSINGNGGSAIAYYTAGSAGNYNGYIVQNDTSKYGVIVSSFH